MTLSSFLVIALCCFKIGTKGSPYDSHDHTSTHH